MSVRPKIKYNRSMSAFSPAERDAVKRRMVCDCFVYFESYPLETRFVYTIIEYC